MEEQLGAAAPVNESGLVDLARDGVEEAAHQEDGKADVQPQADVDDRDQAVGQAQLRGVDLHQRDHVRLERGAHGGEHQVIDGGNELMPHTADRVGGHGAQQRDERAYAHGNHQRVAQRGKEVHLLEGIAVIAPLKHRRQAEGIAGKFAGGLERVGQHQHQREQVEHRGDERQHQQNHGGITLLFQHYICTSRRDVK